MGQKYSPNDLKWGYQQLELNEESRQITTFATHSGLYRYKHLLFGVNAASEQYQYEISRVSAGIVGVENDIIVHDCDQETHDRRLHKVLERLCEYGLTLNGQKWQYNMDKLIFMGILLSAKGIGPTEQRVKATVEAREPECDGSAQLPGFSELQQSIRPSTRNSNRTATLVDEKGHCSTLAESRENHLMR